MKLEVPFYKQITNLDCGPVALHMIFSYFGENYDLDFIAEKAGVKGGKGVSTLRLAIASMSLGFPTKLFSKTIYFDESNMDLDFYKNSGDMNLEESKLLVKEAKDRGIELQEKTLSLEELLDYVSSDSIPIMLLDWNIVLGESEKGYQGHFVPLIGFDDKYIYVHNQGLKNPTAFMKIEKDIFDKARKAKGTDEDILVIYKKR